jgi:hypothetical protein
MGNLRGVASAVQTDDLLRVIVLQVVPHTEKNVTFI